MSVSSISASDPSQQWQQVRNDFQTLSQALQSGNLTAAQKAYASIQDDQQNGPQPPADSQVAKDFTALGKALQSGDLTGAQQAFSSFQSDIQSLRQAGGPPGGKPGDGSQDGSSSSSSSTANASKTISNEATVTNANGTITVTTTYSDGTTSSVTEPNPNPTVSQSALDTKNSGQLQTLLAAQEQSSQT